MTTVYVNPHESIESVIKKFNKKVMDSRILIEVKERQAYVKPSKRRRDEAAAAKSRAAKRKRKTDRQLEFQSMHKFPMRRRPNNNPNFRPNNGQRPNNNPNNNNNRPQQNPQNKPQQAPQAPRVDQPTQDSLKSLQDKFNNTK